MGQTTERFSSDVYYSGNTGWAKKTGPRTHRHNSVEYIPISKIFPLEDSWQLNGYKKIPPHLAYVAIYTTL